MIAAQQIQRVRTVIALAVATFLTAGCVAAAAGAGAAAAIHMTGNSASSEVQGSLANVDARTRTVLNELGVTVESRTERTNGVEYRGTAGDLDVGVDLEATTAGMTRVTATAQRNPVEWDNAYARDLVRRIVAR